MTPLQLAEHYVNETSVSLFLTGKAGTGKTTFLHHIAATTPKRHVVMAPTGVAAINAGGVTIHSFFQLPFCPYLPDVPELVTDYQSPGRHSQLRKNKIDIIRTLELLIIDEVSMVRADLLDAVDASLRRYRRSSRPFGGVQLLLIGDVHQLAPVVTDDEQPYIQRVYASPYFFSSKALQRLGYSTVELTQVFRQQDARFVALLNKVRDNNLDADALAALNARLQPDAPPRKQGLFHRRAEPDPILLTTHNHQADRVNRQHLDALRGRSYIFDAKVSGNFSDSSAPTDPHLELKVGARVMFVKNDSSGARRYYNGMMATVTSVDCGEDGLQATVACDDGGEIVVPRERWENIRYEIGTDHSIRQQVDGVFVQIPLRLAWAVTIHKAQGLTFDRVAVDAADAFTYGQVYVALSRCRTLEGLTLRSPIGNNCLPDSAEVDRFCQSAAPLEQLQQQLDSHRLQYRLQLLQELFNIDALARYGEHLDILFQTRLRKLYPAEAAKFHSHHATILQLSEVSGRFDRQLMHLVASGDETQLSDRVAKGCRYYLDTLAALVSDWDTLSHLEIDNRELNKNYDNLVAQITQQLRVRIRCLHHVAVQGFTIGGYQQAKAAAMLDSGEPAPKKNADRRSRQGDASHAAGSPVPAPDDLVQLIKAWRREECQRQGVPAFHILTQRTLLSVASAMPRTVAQLRAVSGVGPKTIERYGKVLLDLIADYRESQGLQ
ncbi:MAG: HRDC domain-containing protein [bacterium P3]|nr:MAG: HRDC domain-containing protein [bacterium P3]KWW42679.1 MAG: HRDC domain-containing protein [bacterium F083]